MSDGAVRYLMALIERLSTDDPSAFDYFEERVCWWCGEDIVSDHEPVPGVFDGFRQRQEYFERCDHAPDCAWLEARRVLSADLGHHRTKETA
jgi:hypothetical protein